MEEGAGGVGAGRRTHRATAGGGGFRHLHARQQRGASRLGSELIRGAAGSRSRGCASCSRNARHHRDQPAVARRRGCTAAQPRTHARLDAVLRRRGRTGRDLDLAVADPAGADAAIRRRSALSTSIRSSRSAIASIWRCASTACLPRPVSSSGSTANRSTRRTLLHTADGKPRVVDLLDRPPWRCRADVLRLACCSTRCSAGCEALTGTSSLRALLYMDEIAGFFPPVANPPSKLPLLTLLKQGRAFGLGVVLATQNPVDLDYKGLSNIGTWFLGRLQTERDKARVLDGLEGAASGGSRPCGGGSPPVGTRQARVPAAQRARARAPRLPDALDDVVPARSALARPDQDADGGSKGPVSGCSVDAAGLGTRRSATPASPAAGATGWGPPCFRPVSSRCSCRARHPGSSPRLFSRGARGRADRVSRIPRLASRSRAMSSTARP